MLGIRTDIFKELSVPTDVVGKFSEEIKEEMKAYEPQVIGVDMKAPETPAAKKKARKSKKKEEVKQEESDNKLDADQLVPPPPMEEEDGEW